LVAVMVTGSAILIGNMDTDSICSASIDKRENLAELRRMMQIQKVVIPSEHGVGRIVVTGDDTRTSVVFTNRFGDCYVADIEPTNASKTLPRKLLSTATSSFQAIETAQHGPVVFALTQGQLVVLQCSTGKVLAKRTFSTPVSQVAVVAHEANGTPESEAFLVLVAPTEVTASTANDAAQLLAIVLANGNAATVALCSIGFPSGTIVLPTNADSQCSPLCLSVRSDTVEGFRAKADHLLGLWQIVSNVMQHPDQAISTTDLTSAVITIALNSRLQRALSTGDHLALFNQASSGTQVMALLAALLDVPQPTEGFIKRALEQAEVANRVVQGCASFGCD
jgi:hypothetical protein